MSVRRVSIIVPTKNCKHTISRALNSLKMLDYPSYEVIVADSSNDGTDRIASEFGFEVVYAPPTGINVGRNTGIRASSGEIVCFTDGDCEVPPNWLNKIVSEFEKDPRIGCVGGSVIVKPQTFWDKYSQGTLYLIFPIYTEKYTIKKDNISDQPFRRERYPIGCNMTFNKEVLEKLRGFDENWRWGADDIELMYRLLEYGRLIVVNPEIIVYHHPHLSFLELLRRAYRYGAGAEAMRETFHIPFFKNKIKYTLIGALLTVPHALKVCWKTKSISTLVYPFIDILVGISYYLGILRAKFK